MRYFSDYLRPSKAKLPAHVKKFLFMRFNHLQRRNVPVCVEADNFDHAVSRLLAQWPGIPWRDWDYIEELESQHDLGRLGETLRYERPQ